MEKNTSTWTPEAVAQLVARLEADEYSDLDSSLKDWQRLKALQYGAPHLVMHLTHLLEMEVDED